MPEQETASPTPQDTLVLLEKACSTALAMTGGLPATPSSLRVAAGDVAVELHWNGTGAAPAPGNGHAPQAPSVPPPAAAEPDHHLIRAPAVGVYYQAPQPGAPPFVDPGAVVQAGQRVAIIEAMKLMIPVESDRPGRVVRVLVSDGDAVEYDAPLMVLEPLED